MSMQKTKVSIYIENDIIDYINGLIEQGDAYNVASFVCLCVKKHVLALKQTKLESTESQEKS